MRCMGQLAGVGQLTTPPWRRAGLSSGAIAGIAVGATVALLLVIGTLGVVAGYWGSQHAGAQGHRRRPSKFDEI